MSTIITHRQFPGYHKYEMELAGRPLTLEVGKLAELANAAVMVGYGDTRVLVCATASARPRDGIDFFPLSVDFEEKMYSVGRIPGSFNRREGRPGEKGILTSRVIDRPIRPLFPYDFRNDVSVMCTVMAVDHDCSPEIAALIGTSAALAISDIPWNGPVAALKVGLVDGKLVFNPDAEQRKVSDLDVTVVSTGKKVVMIEAGANEVPNDKMFGYLMEKEIAFLGNAVNNPERPFVAILGGSKVSSKISVIDNLIDKVDVLIIGGGMAYTFAKAAGGTVGDSLLEMDYLDYANKMKEKAAAKGVKLLLPVDNVVADAFSNDANTQVVPAGQIPDGWEGLDIGPETAKLFADAVKTAKTVVWNGPMGCFEMPKFAAGTKAVAAALAETDAVTIIGGGDSAAAVNQLGYGDKMTHISTGGGASLEFLEGKELPGVAAANDK